MQKEEIKRGEDSVSTFEEGLQSIEELATKGAKVQVTENQLKVMQNKYLRGDSVELWLRRIARNIALPNVYYYSKEFQKEILKGVKHKITISNDEYKSESLLLQLPE